MAEIEEIEWRVGNDFDSLYIRGSIVVIDTECPVISLEVIAKTDEIFFAGQNNAGKAVVIVWHFDYCNHEFPSNKSTIVSTPLSSPSFPNNPVRAL